jgi:hypothetical protein
MFLVVYCLKIIWIECLYPPYECFFHVKLLNILSFVHLPERVLDTYFEIKGVVLALLHVVCILGSGTFVRFLNFSIQQLKDRENCIVSPNINFFMLKAI